MRLTRIMAALGLILAAAACLLATWLYTRSLDERQIRSGETCTLFERQHEAEIRRLDTTYDYLLGLSRAQRREPLNATVKRQLPDIELRVHNTHPPTYCDEPGLGLKEPGPEIPKRPEGL